MSKNTPFRYDYVGSFLRPETLKRARRDFEEGKISKEELTKVEELEESKNGFFRYEGLKLYLFWAGMGCNIVTLILLIYYLFLA